MNFKKENLNPEEIAKDLQEAVSVLPAFEGWEDYFSGGTGQTIIELIAGSQAIKNHYNLMRVRESSLQHAKMESSIVELAINKGVFRPNAKGCIIEVSFVAERSGKILVGDLLGSYKDLEVYALETYDIMLGNNTTNITIGIYEKKTHDVQSDDDYFQIDFEYDFEFIGDHFHNLLVNDDFVIVDEKQLNLYNPDLNNSVINLVYDYKSRLVFGDGIVGKKVTFNDIITYSTLIYNKDLVADIDLSKILFNDDSWFKDTNFTISRKATSYLDKEKLKRVAVRSTVDGRWVETLDYQSGLMRDFGEYLYDVIAYDNYPQEDLYFLPIPGMVTPIVKAEIQQMIEDKRGNAVQVTETWVDPDLPENYMEVEMNLSYFGNDSDEAILEAIEEYKVEVKNKISLQSYYLVAADSAVEVTKILPNGKMYASLQENFNVPALTYIKTFKIDYVRV